jgi:AF2212-like protein
MVALPIRIRAVFQDGKFVPQEPCALPESAEVQITVEPANITPPLITDPEERKRLLKELVERMKATPLAPDAPKLSRDELHERR